MLRVSGVVCAGVMVIVAKAVGFGAATAVAVSATVVEEITEVGGR